jgi:NitT/TauT family transport system ATP-binding protein
MSDAAVSFENVSLSFGNAVLYDGLEFEVKAGEFVCILGPSGCGKSTALRLIGDLLNGYVGRITVGGLPASEAWDRLAYVFQSPRLLPWRDALDNAGFGLEMRRPDISRDARREIATRQLIRLGLGEDLHKRPAMLSGGERQRVAIARALALDPEIILMDEPFSALDPNTRNRLRALIVDLWKETGKTVIFVTHDIEEALELGERIIVLSAKPGRVYKEIIVDAPRPRNVETNIVLKNQKAELNSIFRDLGEPAREE